MLITKLKNREELLKDLLRPAVAIRCFGCKEVYFPEDEVDAFIDAAGNNISLSIRKDYLCHGEFSSVYIEKYKKEIASAASVIVFSCGTGIQTVAGIIDSERVIAGCDTSYLNGFQGLGIQPWNCQQCGECYLNYTGGICPLTACSKSLINGPCGGYKNGKCEVHPEMDCGWMLIYDRLAKQKRENRLITECRIRNYKRYIDGK